MVLVCVSASFANGVRGSKWGSTFSDVINQEKIEGGTFSQKGMRENGLFEIQFDIETLIGNGISFYQFDKNDKLTSGGIVIIMDDQDWSKYYKWYNGIKDNLEDELNCKPKHTTCQEIFPVDGQNISCQVRKNWMGEQIAFKKVELQNVFNTNDSKVLINLLGGDNLTALLSVIHKSK
jgi:hypothetical protein